MPIFAIFSTLEVSVLAVHSTAFRTIFHWWEVPVPPLLSFGCGLPYSHRTTTFVVCSPPRRPFFPSMSHPYDRSMRSRETVLLIILFSKCIYALMQNVLCRRCQRISTRRVKSCNFQPLNAFIRAYLMYTMLQTSERCCRRGDGHKPTL